MRASELGKNAEIAPFRRGFASVRFEHEFMEHECSKRAREFRYGKTDTETGHGYASNS